VQTANVETVMPYQLFFVDLSHFVSLLDDPGKGGVGFASIAESIDTTAGGSCFTSWPRCRNSSVPSSLNATKAGVSAAKRRGKCLGRPSKLTESHLGHARF
jgi:hypothetical protein